MTRARAVVIGAGIGGLAVTAGLCSAGWDVTACERAASLEPIGAGLALAPNGLRALARYTTARLPRTTDVVRWSRRAATMSTWARPPAVAFRDTVMRLTGTLAPGAALRTLAPIYSWQPPAATRPGDAS